MVEKSTVLVFSDLAFRLSHGITLSLKKEQKQINTVIGHPDGEKRRFVPNLEGPDGLYVLEEVVYYQHGVLDDRDDHEELDCYIKELDITLMMEDGVMYRRQECAAHYEID